MAVVGIVRGYRGREGVPVLRSRPNGSETITSSASSQAGNEVAIVDEYWSVTSSGGAVWVTFAASPTAAAGTTWLIPDGGSLDVQATAGDKCAVIDA